MLVLIRTLEDPPWGSRPSRHSAEGRPQVLISAGSDSTALSVRYRLRCARSEADGAASRNGAPSGWLLCDDQAVGSLRVSLVGRPHQARLSHDCLRLAELLSDNVRDPNQGTRGIGRRRKRRQRHDERAHHHEEDEDGEGRHCQPRGRAEPLAHGYILLAWRIFVLVGPWRMLPWRDFTPQGVRVRVESAACEERCDGDPAANLPTLKFHVKHRCCRDPSRIAYRVTSLRCDTA